MPRRMSSPEFVGRGPELAAMQDALERAAGGEFAAVFLAGESGVGKSRLLREVAREAERRGGRVLGGDCVSYSEGELPYAPVRSALRGLVRELDRDALAELLEGGRAGLARLVPELGVSASPPPADWASGEPGAQADLFELLVEVLSRLGEDAPLVLAIEDIHWADRSTLDFLSFLITAAGRRRLLLVCSYRTDAVHRGHRLRSFLAQHESRSVVERVDLRPFTVDEVSDQLRAILGTTPDPDLAARFHERAEGNAFFTEELLAASTDGSEVPASLRDALLLRIEELPDQVQQVLRLAAAHGRLVPHRLLGAVCELPESELHDALREALAHHILVRHDAERYAFRHALLHETLGSDLLPGERASLHLALARALQDDPTLVSRDGHAAAELCRHWLAAHRLPEALAAAVAAGTDAERIFAFAEASRQFERALELWSRVDDAEERTGMDEAELYTRAADSALVSGDGPGAIRLIRAAIAKPDTAADAYRSASLREQLGRYLFMGAGDTEGAQLALQEAVDLLPAGEPRPELARSLAMLGAILMLRGLTLESMERCEQAIALARQAGARAAEAHALDTQGMNLANVGDRSTGIAYLRESLRMSDEIADAYGLFRAYLNLSDALDMDGRIDESAELALEGAARARELGMVARALALEGRAATRMFKLGRLEEADRLTATALDLRPSLAKLNQCGARAQLEVHRGRSGDAGALIRAAEEATPSVSWADWMEPLASSRVELELLRGRPQEARTLGEKVLDLAAEHEHVFHTARLRALTVRADALLAESSLAAGDDAAAADASGRARALADRIEHLLEREAGPGTPPPETMAYRGLCTAEARRAAGAATASDWAAVAARWAELSVPLEEAYARLREAECLVLDGDRGRAEEPLAAGLRITKEAGARWLQDQLESLARRARLEQSDGPAPPDDPVERLGLTERELAVLELVAAGKTNRQIGEELFMAPKTASVHVSRILSKLDVSSRVEAATAAQRLGIVP